MAFPSVQKFRTINWTVMRRLIIFCLKGDKKKFLAVTKFGTTGTNNRNKFNIYIKFNFLRENRLFNFGN